MDEQTPDRPPPPDPAADAEPPAVLPVPRDPDEPPAVMPAGEEPPAVLPVFPSPPAENYPPAALGFVLFLAVSAVVYLAMWIVPGEPRKIALAGLQSLPFLGLALLAYASDRYEAGRALTVAYWVLLLGFTGVAVWVTTVGAVADPAGLQAIKDTPKGQRPDVGLLFLPGGGRAVSLSLLGIAVSGLAAALGFLPPVRRAFARVLPMDPDSFVHATALATVLAVTAICTVPLVVLGHPPLLKLIEHFAGQEGFAEDLAEEGQLRDMLYGLAWLVPVAVLAVGYPLVRTLPAALERVGLVRPTGGQVGFALGTAGVLYVVMSFVDHGITEFWANRGWNQTDARLFEQMMKAAISPAGAVVIGITAGLGEELAVRGVLQPRMGLWLSNLFFTALHALQYNFDALLSVFLIGMTLGVIRRYTNTTTTAIIHGVYDFVLVYLTYLQFDLVEHVSRQLGWG
jgi:membrane protease YdiL (CAAX protease family)